MQEYLLSFGFLAFLAWVFYGYLGFVIGATVSIYNGEALRQFEEEDDDSLNQFLYEQADALVLAMCVLFGPATFVCAIFYLLGSHTLNTDVRSGWREHGLLLPGTQKCEIVIRQLLQQRAEKAA